MSNGKHEKAGNLILRMREFSDKIPNIVYEGHGFVMQKITPDMFNTPESNEVMKLYSEFLDLSDITPSHKSMLLDAGRNIYATERNIDSLVFITGYNPNKKVYGIFDENKEKVADSEKNVLEGQLNWHLDYLGGMAFTNLESCTMKEKADVIKKIVSAEGALKNDSNYIESTEEIENDFNINFLKIYKKGVQELKIYKKWTEEYLEKYGNNEEVKTWDNILSDVIDSSN